MATLLHKCVKKCLALGRVWEKGETTMIDGPSPTKYLRPLKNQPVIEDEFENEPQTDDEFIEENKAHFVNPADAGTAKKPKRKTSVPKGNPQPPDPLS